MGKREGGREEERERNLVANLFTVNPFSTQVLLAMTLFYLLLAWTALTLRQSHTIPRLKKAIVPKW